MEILDKFKEKAQSAFEAIKADWNESRLPNSAKKSAKNPQTFNEIKKEIDEFGKNLDVDPYMSFVVSYFKNKVVDESLADLDRSDLLEIERRAIGKDKDENILKYCFDYSDKDIRTLTKTYKDYILDKDLVKFCMDKLTGSMSKGGNLRISQCTIPTFVLYNPHDYKFLIDYAKFESQSKYKALGDILTHIMGVKLLEIHAKCTSSILISPRVFIDEKDEMIREIKTDTQFIEEELKSLDIKGSLFAILPKTWLTKDEEAKRKLIANNLLATVVELPSYKMINGKDLIWLHFKKGRHSKDKIKIYGAKEMQYSNEGNTSSEELQEKMNKCVPKLEDINQFLKRFDDDNKRNTIDRLYGDYMRIIETRFTAQASKDITSIIKNDLLMPLHFPSNNNGKEAFIKEESDILKEEKSLGEKIGRTILTAFLESLVTNDLIKEKEAYEKLTLHDKIIYIARQKTNNEFEVYKEGCKCIIKLQSFEYEVPEFVLNTLFSMKDLGNFGAHKEKSFENSCTNRRDRCGNLKNSIISCSFDFLDVLQWYNKFLKEIEEENDCKNDATEDDYDTPNDNALTIEQIDKTTEELSRNDNERFLVKIDNRTKYCVYKGDRAKFAPSYAVNVGEYVQLLEVSINSGRDSEEYKYFVRKARK